MLQLKYVCCLEQQLSYSYLSPQCARNDTQLEMLKKIQSWEGQKIDKNKIHIRKKCHVFRPHCAIHRHTSTLVRKHCEAVVF